MLKIDSVITNGYVDEETISKRAESGWNFVTTLPARMAHPHAMETDKITIFSRYEKSSIESDAESNAVI